MGVKRNCVVVFLHSNGEGIVVSRIRNTNRWELPSNIPPSFAFDPEQSCTINDVIDDILSYYGVECDYAIMGKRKVGNIKIVAISTDDYLPGSFLATKLSKYADAYKWIPVSSVAGVSSPGRTSLARGTNNIMDETLKLVNDISRKRMRSAMRQ